MNECPMYIFIIVINTERYNRATCGKPGRGRTDAVEKDNSQIFPIPGPAVFFSKIIQTEPK